MPDSGKASKGAVESFRASGSTNIGDGLLVAAKVLDGRRHRNAIASIILLSDGHDNRTSRKSHNDLVPHSLMRRAGNRCSPVHTFGFGMDHDAAAMHAIAEVNGGTFSFIENQAVVQEARVAVESLHPGVRVRAVKSGCYESRVDADDRAASVDAGELYADEERCFLLFVDVPVAAGDDGEDGGVTVTLLIKASCTYRDATTGRSVDVACEDAVVKRPVVVADMEPSMEVVRERFRVEAAEDIAAARAAAKRGQHAVAARILDQRQEASAAAGLSDDARCAALAAELRELSARVADRREYEQTGRACLLAGMSSHAQQRASTVQLFGAAAPSSFGSRGGGGSSPGDCGAFSRAACGGRGAPFGNIQRSFGAPAGGEFAAATRPVFGALQSPAFGAAASAPSFGAGYMTPAMQSMVESSRKTREQQQQTTATKDGSLFGFK